MANAQDSAALNVRNLFVKDDRLRPPWRILLFCIALPILTIVVFTAYFIIAGGFNQEPSRLVEEILAEIAAATAALILSFWMRRFVDRRSIASLGLSPRRPAFRLLFIGLAFGGGMQAFTFAVQAAGGATHVTGLRSLVSDAGFLGTTLVLFLIVALFEELVFRGYLFQNCWEGFGLVPAVVITSALFACLHLYNPNAQVNLIQTLAGLLVFAVWACCSVVWTKSLWLALGAHLAWNFFEGPVFGFPVSGLVMPKSTVFSQTTGGPAWFTGGGFGPEAGVSSLIALGLGFVALYLLYRHGAFADSPDVREGYARA